MNVAIILAGGEGVRFGDEIPKQFLILHGKRIIDYSIKTFEEATRIDKIIIGGMHPNPPVKYRKQINFQEDADIISEKTKLVKHPRPSYNINALKLCDNAQIKWKGIESELNRINNQILLFAGDMDPYFDWIKDAAKKLKNSQSSSFFNSIWLNMISITENCEIKKTVTSCFFSIFTISIC